jgi:hypothetical protein
MTRDLSSADVDRYLDKLESIVDIDHVQRTSELQRLAFSYQEVDHVPTVIEYPVPSDEWPAYRFDEILDDPGKMLLHELRRVYAGAKLGDDRLYGIRANYGTGIIASAFGCEIRRFERTLPIALSLGRTEIDRILDAGIPDLHSGLLGRALDTVAYYRQALAAYPKLSRVVGSCLLDIQGPFDNASIIWGSDVFFAVYDEPDTLHRLLKLLSATIEAVVIEHRRIDCQPLEEADGKWHHLGGLCIRDDSAVNLSREQFLKFVKPYDAGLLSKWGGLVHFCGCADQWWDCLLDIPRLRGINPYQGEFYDLVNMYAKCKAAGVAIVQWTKPVEKTARSLVRTGFSRLKTVPSFVEARRALETLYRTGHADS